MEKEGSMGILNILIRGEAPRALTVSEWCDRIDQLLEVEKRLNGELQRCNEAITRASSGIEVAENDLVVNDNRAAQAAIDRARNDRTEAEQCALSLRAELVQNSRLLSLAREKHSQAEAAEQAALKQRLSDEYREAAIEFADALAAVSVAYEKAVAAENEARAHETGIFRFYNHNQYGWAPLEIRTYWKDLKRHLPGKSVTAWLAQFAAAIGADRLPETARERLGAEGLAEAQGMHKEPLERVLPVEFPSYPKSFEQLFIQRIAQLTAEQEALDRKRAADLRAYEDEMERERAAKVA